MFRGSAQGGSSFAHGNDREVAALCMGGRGLGAWCIGVAGGSLWGGSRGLASLCMGVAGGNS